MAERPTADVPGCIDQRRAPASRRVTDLHGRALALPIGYWIYIGFTYSAYIGGEVKQASKTQPRMMMATLPLRVRGVHARLLRALRRRRAGLHELVVYLGDDRESRSPGARLLRRIMTGSTVLNVIMEWLRPLERPAPLRDRHDLHPDTSRLVVRRRSAATARDSRRAAHAVGRGDLDHRDRGVLLACTSSQLLHDRRQLHRHLLGGVLDDELRRHPPPLPAAPTSSSRRGVGRRRGCRIR